MHATVSLNSECRLRNELPPLLAILLPLHDKARSVRTGLQETKPLIKSQRPAEIVNMQPNRLAPHRSLEAKTHHDDTTDSPAAVIRQDCDIEDTHFVIPVVDIQAPDGHTGPLNDPVLSLVIGGKVKPMLGIVLLRHNLVVEIGLARLQQ